VLPVVVAGALFGALAGCGHDRTESTASSAVSTDQAGAGPSARPDPARTTAPPAPTTEAGPSPAASGDSSGGSAGAGASGTSGGTASGSPGGSDASEQATSPAVAASPVFLGEPCAPTQDSAPATAINGLTLFCVARSGAAGAAGLGSWSNNPPKQQPTGPAPGAECTSSDLGQVQQDQTGRPVACLREPNGDLRWADIS
jgi:hypothetical protein